MYRYFPIFSHRLSTFLLTCLAFLTVHCSRAQDLAPIGTDSTFDVATWNIEWFGSTSNGPSDDPLQFSNVLSVIRQSDIDLWGVQEIADRDEFDVLLDSLGNGFDGVLATNSGQQRIGFIYRTEVVHLKSVRHILEDFTSPFASRPPLKMEADITVDDITREITFIVVHLKAFGDQESYNKRLESSQRLKSHIDLLHGNDAVMLIGDYNDELTSSTSGNPDSPFKNFVDDPEDYLFPSLSLEQNGQGSFCSNSNCSAAGSMLDHIMITNELFGTYTVGSSTFYSDAYNTISRYRDTASDHRIVVASFDFSTNTSAENEAPASHALAASIYPNPFVETATISIDLPSPMPLRIQLFDMLGRQIQTIRDHVMPAGRHEIMLDAASWMAGTYWVEVSTPETRKAIRVTRSH